MSFFLRKVQIYQIYCQQSNIIIMYQKQLYKVNKLTPLALKNLGFEQAISSSLPKNLYEVDLKQAQCCWRDALNMSLQNFYKLQGLLVDAGTQKKWKFYNIVICSSQDRVSSITFSQLQNSIRDKRPSWKVGQFQTIFITIDMVQNQQIYEVCKTGGQNWSIYQATFQNFGQCLDQVFNKFNQNDKKGSLMDSQVDQYNFGLIKQQYCGIGISIDGSIKMREKWENIINKLGYSMRNSLKTNDIVLGIIFNKKTWLVSKQSKQQFQNSLKNNQNPYVIPQNQNPPPQNPRRNAAQNNQNQANYVLIQVEDQYQRKRRRNRCAKTCCCIITSALISFFIRLIIIYSSK